MYDFLSVTALTMVAFLLGSSLTLEELRTHGQAILTISALIVVVTMALVTGGLWLLGLPLPLAVLLGAIATATDPAATHDAIRQAGKTGPFPDILKGIVAIDDAWGLIAFSMAIVLAVSLGQRRTALWPLRHRRVGSGRRLGAWGADRPARRFSDRAPREGEPMQTEALGHGLSDRGPCDLGRGLFLLAGMTAGALVANLARHHEPPFTRSSISSGPFMILFFLLAGASLDLAHLNGVGLALWRLCRPSHPWARHWRLDRRGHRCSPAKYRPWYGMALLPQAGVAVGMALVAAQEFPQYAAF